MNDTTSSWSELTGWIQIGDVLDVAVVAGIAYLLLGAVGGVRARAMVLIVALLIAINFLATRLGMSLTVEMMRAGAIVLLVAAAVAFRDEIRRAVQRLTSWHWLGSASDVATDAEEILVEAMERFAERRIGALVVIPGRETCDAHVHGGFALDGRLSSALLESLFDPNSLGHDGAIILEGQQVRRFGVHLPLARTTKKLRHLGTRHAAALGLSERCDALVVVVSEERGVISVAKEGHLEGPFTPTLLAARLRAHSAPAHEQPARARFSPARAAGAVAIAGVLWFGLVFQKGTAEQTIEMPVEYANLPQDHVVVHPMPSNVSVIVSGRRAAFAALQEEPRLQIDLSDAGAGTHDVVLGERNISLPPSLKVQQFRPSTLRLRIARTRLATRPVRVTIRRPLPDDVTVEALPATVRVRVPVDAVAGDRSIRTAPLDLEGVSLPATITERLVLPPGVRLAEGEPGEVTVHVRKKAPTKKDPTG